MNECTKHMLLSGIVEVAIKISFEDLFSFICLISTLSAWEVPCVAENFSSFLLNLLLNKSIGIMMGDGSTTASSNKDNWITITILGALASIYIYLLLSPSQPHLLTTNRNFVIQKDTMAAYTIFYDSFKKGKTSTFETWGANTNYSYSSSNKEWGAVGDKDDFFLTGYEKDYPTRSPTAAVTGPVVPSESFRCSEGWLTIRAEINYKYLWMHTGENGWMGATATMDTPLHRRSYQMVPVNDSCEKGWLRLREADSAGFLMMVAPSGSFALDEWVVKVGSTLLNETAIDERYHFLLEEAGYLLNKGSMAFINVLPEAEYGVRGHTSGWDRTKAAGRQYGAMMHFNFVNSSDVQNAIAEEEVDIRETDAEDVRLVAQIAAFPKSNEKRVISFGLYGTREKYTIGAVHNAELVGKYFPGWICRYYVTSDVPESILDSLRKAGAEIENVPKGMGYSSGMFWRFMVAGDSSVDRFIVRDVDSRLNARDRCY